MNDHLIRKLKISLVWSLLEEFLIGSILIYFFNSIQPIESYVWLIFLIYPVYSMLKANKIILEIIKIENDFIVKSYSLFKGKQELKLNINDIIELDFFREFLIKYKSSEGNIKDVFQINAEPWNTIYGQIKQLKLAEQYLKTMNTDSLNVTLTE